MALRAPEIILGDRLGTAIDIWSFGCLVFEMLMGRSLFVNLQSLDGKPYDEISNDEHLIQLWEVIGPLPEPLLVKWRRADQYFSPDGERLKVKSHQEEYGSEDEEMGVSRDQHQGLDVDLDLELELELDHDLDEERPGSPGVNASGSSDSLSLASLAHFVSLEDQFQKEKPSDLDEAEGNEILHLLRWIFQYDPAQRPSAKEIISHPWFSS